MIAAIIPAAGVSSRMGRPKLLLEIEGVPLIVRVIHALKAGGVDRIVVVVAPRSQEGARETAKFAEDAGAEVDLLPFPTPDMRATIEHGVLALDQSPPVGVLIAPADSVGLTPRLVARMVAEFRQKPDRIAVPIREGKRGHPLVLPWSEAMSIASLPASVGVNALLAARHDLVDEIEVDEPGHDEDLDTPEDYARWTAG